MTYYLRNGNTYRPSDEASLDLHTTLPVGNYIIKQDQFGNMFFEQVDSFELRGKRYGDNNRNTTRIIDTFLSRDNATGVMLTGEKGSGKSLLAKSVAVAAAEQGIPTVIINRAWHGDAFNSFIQSIQQPAVILFDEFEKVYDREEQEAILTLLDGVFPTKKLFMLTCNDKWRVDAHMRNRPGRIFYMLDFVGLDIDFVREYCEDNLAAKEHIDTICKITSLFEQFNFDMLKALVEEMNRYGETPQEALRMLNVKPEFGDSANYNVTLARKGEEVSKDNLGTEVWSGNPLAKMIEISYYQQEPSGDGETACNEWYEVEFTQDDLVSVDAKSGKFVFEDNEGYRLTLLKKSVYGNTKYYDLL